MSTRFGDSTNTFSTAPSALHGIRRAALMPMFSKRKMNRFEPIIREKLQLMCEKIAEFSWPFGGNKGKEILTLSNAFQAFAEDVIMEYAFGFSYQQLRSKGFEDNVHHTNVVASEFGHLVIQFPSMYRNVRALPMWIMKRLLPDLGMQLKLQVDIRHNVSNIMNGNDKQHDSSKHPSIFHELLESSLPPSEKTAVRLGDEGRLMIGAGVESTGWALTVISFYLISNPIILAKLRTELETAIPDPKTKPDVMLLEKLPYLKACIQEGFRLANNVTARSPRISPNTPIKYINWSIPVGIPVSMTFLSIHNDERIFPNSQTYIPERWLGSPRTRDGQSLNKYFVTFGKGPRSCLGINLAHTEILLVIATLFRRFKFELFETDITDIELKHALFIPLPKMDTKGLRVKVQELFE